ncbi:MAG: DUF2062 domain-containing protein [Puniceicoccaceae bacterium]
MEERQRQEHHRRIRRVKWMLRPLPRRTNIHRYPILRWFSKTARARSYLWSFRSRFVVRSFYVGWVLTLLPLYGLQILLAALLAIAVRANLMVLVGLQLVSNPLTVAPIWYGNYLIGEKVLSMCGSKTPTVIAVSVEEARAGGLGFFESLKLLIDRIKTLEGAEVIDLVGRVFLSASFGGILVGLVMGLICSTIYVRLARSARRHHIPVLERIDDGNHSAVENPSEPPSSPSPPS